METQSAEINELASALAKAQAAIKPAKKDSDNPFFKSKYADLASVHLACMEHLTVNGLSVTQTLYTNGDARTYLVTSLLHSSGQWIKSVAPVNPVKNDPQGMGSAITYMRRYSLAAMVGVAQEDDDGNAASDKKTNFSMALDREQAEQIYAQALQKIGACDSLSKLESTWKGYAKTLKSMPQDLAADLIQKKDDMKEELARQNGVAA